MRVILGNWLLPVTTTMGTYEAWSLTKKIPNPRYTIGSPLPLVDLNLSTCSTITHSNVKTETEKGELSLQTIKLNPTTETPKTEQIYYTSDTSSENE